jgi:hypothetical protein
VQIVLSGAGSWTNATRPKFSESIEIGAGSDTSYQFGLISAVDVGPDGAIYVLDSQAQIIRAFDSGGTFLRTIGRKGNGPGELRGATAMFVTAGDTMLVADMGGQNLVRFGTDGSPLGTLEMPIMDGIPVKWVERLDGSVVVQSRFLDMAALGGAFGGRGRGAAPPASSSAPVDRLLLRNPSGTIADTIFTLPGGQTMQVGGARGMTMRLFAPEPMWTLGHDGGVYYGVNNEYSINVYDTGGALKRIVRRDVKRHPVTEETKVALKAAIVKAMQDQIASVGMAATAELVDAVSEMIEFADYFPAIGNLLAGPNGTLWVQQALSPEELTKLGDLNALQNNEFGSALWDVYDSAGALLGELRMPEHFTPLRWIDDRLAGIGSDDSGLQRAVLLRVSGLCPGAESSGERC